MSMFTEFNGPQNNPYGGLNVTKLTELITAFENMRKELNAHINNKVTDVETQTETEETGSGTVKEVSVTGYTHGIKQYIDEIKKAIETLQTTVDEKNSDVVALKNTVGSAEEQSGLVNDVSNLDSKIGNLGNDTTVAAEIALINDKIGNDFEEKNIASKISDINNSINYIADTLGITIPESTQSNDSSLIQNTSATSITAAIAEIYSSITAISEIVKTENDKKVIEADSIEADNLKLKNYFDMTEMTLVYPRFAGTGAANTTDTNGLYVIGKLSDDLDTSVSELYLSAKSKSGIAFIKSADSNTDFNAIVEMTATHTNDVNNPFTGTILAHVSKQAESLKHLKFHLVCGMGESQPNNIYLCMSADNLPSEVSGSSIGSLISSLHLYASGINFIPLATTDKAVQTVRAGINETVAMPDNATDMIIASELATKNFVATAIATEYYKDSNGDDIIKIVADETGAKTVYVGSSDKKLTFLTRPGMLLGTSEEDATYSYFVTRHDIEKLAYIPIGSILKWHDSERVARGEPYKVTTGISFDEATGEFTKIEQQFNESYYKAKNIPNGWLACNGETFDSDTYPELAEALGSNELPIINAGIIKAKNIILDEELPEDIVLDLETLYNLIRTYHPIEG